MQQQTYYRAFGTQRLTLGELGLTMDKGQMRVMDHDRVMRVMDRIGLIHYQRDRTEKCAGSLYI